MKSNIKRDTFAKWQKQLASKVIDLNNMPHLNCKVSCHIAVVNATTELSVTIDDNSYYITTNYKNSSEQATQALRILDLIKAELENENEI